MTLEEHNIYAIPSGDRFGKTADELLFIYAPLSGKMLMADSDTVEKLNAALNEKENDEDIELLLNLLQDTSEEKRETVHAPEDYHVLYVLPNFICNFSCSYCYSAKGRSKKELSQSQLKSTIDYFVDKKRGQKALKITFVGGGEPMMSWKLVKFGIEYASILAKKQGIELFFGLITNGSILNRDILDTLSRYKVMPRISFEILEEIQNKQRGQYDKVCQTIDKLIENGVSCEVRSMITPDNVMLMEEMVREILNRFPAIYSYYFDPITDPRTFSAPETTAQFYKTYNQSFLNARQIAKSHGKELKNAVLRSLDTVVERYCNGEFCLTPEGTISICLEVSSPAEDNYQQHIYGIVDNDSITIDTEKFHILKEKEMAQQNPSCQTCFIKWNCGGGCMANNAKYSQKVLEVICESNRNLSLSLLLDRLDEEYKEETGMTLEELINK